MLYLLKDPEVARFLLDFILETPGGRRTVSRISRTCKALSAIALNSLWRELDSILPLLSLMPGHLFKRARRPGMGFDKAPQVGDWKRVLVHGERVQKIAYNESVGNVHPSIFSVIEECKTRDYILPNLKALHWKVESAEGLERSLLFLTPQLRCLSVEIGSGIPQDELAEFLTEVSSCTRLTTLSITSPTRLPHYLPRLMQQQTTLEKVALVAPGALSPSIGRWVSSLSSLRSLQIDVGDRSDGVIASFFNGVPTSGRSSPGFMSPDFVMTPLSGAESTVLVNFAMESGFKQLRHLSITGEVGSAANFLARVSAPLEAIELALDEPEEAKEWRSLWTILSRQYRNSLRSFVISPSGNSRFVDLIRSTARGDNVSRRLRLDGLELLPNLTRFEVDLPESRVFLDQDLQNLALSCPNLEVVKLCPLSRWPISHGPPKATLAGLALLTANCKRMHTLHIPIHACRTENTSLFEIETSSQSLVRLHVGHSWVDDPLGVAILLSHFAPYLEGIKFFHEKNRPGYIEAHSVGWQRVSEILPQLQQLRLHERSQSPAVVERVPAPIVPPSPPSYIRLPGTPQLKKTVSRAVQVKPPTADFNSQTKANVRHKNISTKPMPSDMHDQIVDARPYVRDESISVAPPVREQAVDVRPILVSKLVETLVIPARSTVSASTSPIKETFDEKLEISEEPNPTASGYLSRTAVCIAQILRALSPPILLRLFNFWSLFMIGQEKSTPYPNGVVSSTRSPLLFGPKFNPSCP
ncbi:hypothetical protein DFH11DRAFT_19304 [Phellopilus nigrolimitatus]|nr:hypothetical protein DFH11DRAFT_19304 [Phellopilus nigrolimitatus]